MMRELQLLSVVVPMLDEVDSVVALHERLSSALAGLPLEFVFVDDGSTDGTFEALQTIASRDDRVTVIRLSRNFGHQPALTAGLEHTRGNAVVMIDADLQDPPEVIPELVQAWRTGGDVVIARRERRDGETWFKLLTARLFYRVMSSMSHIPLEPDAGDFRLLDRAALNALLAMPERTRFLRGMTMWVGFEQVVVAYERHGRHAGRTKYPLRRMVRLAVDGITSFSRLPLQLATILGFLFSLLALVGAPVALVAKFVNSSLYVPGITSLLIVVLLLGGLQLMTIGLIGEYVARIYDEVKRRPLYVVRERLGSRPPAERELGLPAAPSEPPTTEMAAVVPVSADRPSRSSERRLR